MKEGFIYLWYDRKHKRYYIGCHWGTLDDGYVCSSRWMRQAHKRRPEDFKRRILQRGLEKKGLKEQEVKWLSLIKTEELGTRYYNLSKILTGNGWKKGTPRSEGTKKRVSEGLKRAYDEGTAQVTSSAFKKGQVPWNKGKTGIYSEETKEKIRQAAINQVNRKTNKGFKHTDEWKKANSERLKKEWASGRRKGYIPSEETKEKLRQKMIGNQNARKK